MSNDAPRRTIQGLGPRIAAPDLTRLQAKNRPAQTENRVDLASPEGGARLQVGGQSAEVDDSAPKMLKPRVPESTSPLSVSEKPAGETDVTKRRATIYLDANLTARAKAAYKATSYAEGDRSWSDFVEKAIDSLVHAREEAHNEGRPYEPDSSRLAPGRPLG
jgi:hypothetical protein